MIEIVAKDYSHFYNILQEYEITEEKAIFIPWKAVEVECSCVVPAYKATKIEGSDWLDYRSFQ